MRILAIILLVAAACSSASTPVTVTEAPAAPTTVTAPLVEADEPVAVDTTAAQPPPSTTASTPATTTALAPFEPVLTPIAAGFAQPVFLDAPPGDARLFIVDQTGVVFVIDGADPETYLDITDRVRMSGEQGLLGLAFHPDFGANGRFYVHYTDSAGRSVVEEFTDTGGTRTSTKVLLSVDQPASNHNGGMIAFGPDGNLWIALGDGGRANDAFGHGQRADTLLGTLLRIDVNGDPYAVPDDNPFVDGGGAAEVAFYGLRNPWRFSFDGDDVWIADVGQGDLEEVNRLSIGDLGANLGWPIYEGTACFDGPCDADGLVSPVTEYTHADGCSITGGYVSRSSALSEIDGHYFYGDFCSGFIRSFEPDSGETVDWTDALGTVRELTSFGTDDAGNLYVLSGQGTVFRLDRN